MHPFNGLIDSDERHLAIACQLHHMHVGILFTKCITFKKILLVSEVENADEGSIISLIRNPVLIKKCNIKKNPIELARSHLTSRSGVLAARFKCEF